MKSEDSDGNNFIGRNPELRGKIEKLKDNIYFFLLLFGELSVEQISKLTDFRYASDRIREALHKLSSEGIVKIKEYGSLKTYYADESVVWALV